MQAAFSPARVLPEGELQRSRVEGRVPRADAALVRRAQRGSGEAIEQLVRRHWDGAHRTAFLIVHDAHVAEDIAQEAMLSAIRAIDSFDRRRPFAPWLHRIVVNRALDCLRSRRRQRETSMNHLSPADLPADRPEPGPGVSNDLLSALARLEPEQRALVVLRHLLGYRSSELARMLELPAATVRTRLARALERLRLLVDAEGSELR